MKVFSMFDGVATCRYVLDQLNIPVEKYYASEIEEAAIAVSSHHYPDIEHLGDITALDLVELKENIGEIDLLVGGSPCQNLSRAVINNIKHNQGLEGEKSKLFYNYLAIKEYFNPKYFMLENVESMSDEDRDTITEAMGVEPIMIDAALFSAQSRKRYFWTNIPVPDLPQHDSPLVINDIVDTEFAEKYWYKDKEFDLFDKPRGSQIGILGVNGHDILKRIYNKGGKSPTLTTVQGGYQEKKIMDYHSSGKYLPRKLTPSEYEKLQGFDGNYTNIRNPRTGRLLSDSARYSMMGNGWSVPVIKYIFGGLL